MAFVRVASLSELEPDSVREVAVNGEFYALCHAGGRVTALSGTCIHRGGPLGQGNIEGGRVVCPWHAWEFDCATGEYDRDAALRVPCFAVQIEGDNVWIDIP